MSEDRPAAQVRREVAVGTVVEVLEEVGLVAAVEEERGWGG
jgi:hypothetical protein